MDFEYENFEEKWNPNYDYLTHELGNHRLGAFISEPDYVTSIMNSVLQTSDGVYGTLEAVVSDIFNFLWSIYNGRFGLIDIGILVYQYFINIYVSIFFVMTWPVYLFSYILQIGDWDIDDQERAMLNWRYEHYNINQFGLIELGKYHFFSKVPVDDYFDRIPYIFSTLILDWMTIIFKVSAFASLFNIFGYMSAAIFLYFEILDPNHKFEWLEPIVDNYIFENN